RPACARTPRRFRRWGAAAGQQPQQSGLAGSAPPQQRHLLPAGDREVNAAQRGDLLAGGAVDVDQVVAADRAGCHAGASRSWLSRTPWTSATLAATAAASISA